VYVVNRIVEGKVILLDQEAPNVKVVVNVIDFAPVKIGDVVQVT